KQKAHPGSPAGHTAEKKGKKINNPFRNPLRQRKFITGETHETRNRVIISLCIFLTYRVHYPFNSAEL
ncbi:MAG TPA: hypothetical protein PKX40_19990, partial [Spirochaetota bacterium]|nr:hypothetical protein [Spirochaetota bacterium]